MDYKGKARVFTGNPPYTQKPFSSRNWGGKWHSLCSYHGKIKPSIAHFLISEFTQKGDIVLDPLCGVGTIPFEACFQGRIGIGNDLSQLAYCVTKGKIEQPDQETALEELEKLNVFINEKICDINFENIPYSSFGFNKTLNDYFESRTLAEIILAREYFLEIQSPMSAEQAMVMASIMHILHGNRPYALSRRSHPLTPYAPQGNFEYKSLIEHARKKVLMTFSDPLPDSFRPGQALFGSYEDLSAVAADAIITSPPFAGSMRFYMQNWMRLWFSGWEDVDFRKASTRFLDSIQDHDMSVYEGFFKVCADNLNDRGIMILHLGKSSQCDMADSLQRFSQQYFTVVHAAEEDVSRLEKHGIKDKGGTVSHQFLFLEKR